LPLLTMDADVPFADLPACGTGHVRAKCCLRIDDTPPFGPMHRRVSPDPLSFSSPAARPPFSVHLPTGRPPQKTLSRLGYRHSADTLS
jgi:hypothetical protein